MPILLTGASGQLGAYVLERLGALGLGAIAWSGSESGTRSGIPLQPVDLASPAATLRGLDEADPSAVLHAAAISSAEGVRLDPERAQRVNVDATRVIADWCARRSRRLVFTSTDLVFDGSKPWNREGDPAKPVLSYGRTKLDAEAAVLAVPGGVVARLSLLYGESLIGRLSFYDRAVVATRYGQEVTAFQDEYRTPLDYPTASAVLVRLLGSDFSGLIHVGGAERRSRYELIRDVVGAFAFDPRLVRPNRQADVPTPEPRPADVSLDTSRLMALFPDLERLTIEQYVDRHPVQRHM
jgi:dTDP-4-dehydrorhamnose reductase